MHRGLVFVALLALALSSTAFAAAGGGPTAGCATIKSGTILDSAGNPLSTGYDQYGYNYQAHVFNGTYDGVDRVLGNDNSDFADDSLLMKWSDPWLANVDCNGDHKLDRGLVNGVVNGTSMGWLTNQYNGDYDSDANGSQDAHYTWFDKFVWVGAGGIWGQFDIVQEVANDPAGGLNGLQFKIGAPGFGLNDGWTTL
jgi:hypothetical protein